MYRVNGMVHILTRFTWSDVLLTCACASACVSACACASAISGLLCLPSLFALCKQFQRLRLEHFIEFEVNEGIDAAIR